MDSTVIVGGGGNPLYKPGPGYSYVLLVLMLEKLNIVSVNPWTRFKVEKRFGLE